MTEAPTPEDIQETISIEKDNIKYSLHITTEKETITFIISTNDKIFIRKMTLKELKDTESNPINLITSYKDLISYLKTLSEMKKLVLDIKPNMILIIFEIEFLFKKHKIEIELLPEGKNFDMIGKELYRELKNKINELENKNSELEKEIKEIKNILKNVNINKITLNNKSVIMKDDEFDLIHLAIRSRLNKPVKELKKLYQASVDGDGAINFHSRCDNISNTLVIIQSAGNKRFGGFTTAKWESTNKTYKDDPNAFVFSLDKKKIYCYNKNGKAIRCYKEEGPCFGSGTDIGVGQYCIQRKSLWTNESQSTISYDYSGDKNGLSETGGSVTYALELEVFQVILE